MTLTLNFQGQIWNLLYISQKWSDCHETKSKHTDWTLGLKCDHWIWPWLWPWPWFFKVKRSNMEFAISQAKMVRSPREEKQTYQLNSKLQMWPSGLTLAMTLSLIFQGQIWNLLLPKVVRLLRNEKQTYRLNSKPQMWPSGLTLAMTLTLYFQGQIWNLLYLSQKWSDCHETKSKHIDWTQSLKCDHWVWPWPWPWPWFFKVKYGICYISAKSGPIATKWKANISIELKASNVTIRFDWGDFSCRRAIDSSSFWFVFSAQFQIGGVIAPKFRSVQTHAFISWWNL